MKKLSQSMVLLLLTTSLACAAGREELLEKAINKGDLQEVRALLEAGELDLNKGLGAGLKPSLLLALENLGTELKEHPKDVAWYLVAGAFGAVALGGLYKLVRSSSEKKTFNFSAEVREALVQNQVPAAPLAAGVGSVPTEDAKLQAPVEQAAATSVAATAESKPLGSKSKGPGLKIDVTSKKKRFRFGPLTNLAAGVAGAVGALKKAKDSSAPSRTPMVEERLKIVKLLAQQPSINVFAADASGNNALDLVIAYLSAYEQGSECYNCMEEAKKSITERSIREVYELYSDLSKSLELEPRASGECLCTEGGECSCDDCCCTPGQES